MPGSKEGLEKEKGRVKRGSPDTTQIANEVAKKKEKKKRKRRLETLAR
jgi:hypothetical protein